jgi:hypothetical protein
MLGIAKVPSPIKASKAKQRRNLFALFLAPVIAFAFELAITLAIIRTFQIY